MKKELRKEIVMEIKNYEQLIASQWATSCLTMGNQFPYNGQLVASQWATSFLTMND